MLSHPSIRIGCSGWQYQHWRGDFYPAELPPSRWLEAYAQRFDTVEINNTFYRLPEASTFADWAGRVPRRFVFAVKAIAGDFHTTVRAVAQGIFWTLAMRPLGALFFGFLAERYGRRPILMVNVVSYSLCELASAAPPSS